MARGLPVDLTVCADQPPRLYVAADLAASLHLGNSPSQEELHFGKRSVEVTVVPTPTLSPGTAQLTRVGARTLKLPQPIRLHMFRTSRHALRLGPLIGVFISDEKRRELLDGLYDSVYMRFTRYAAELGACLIFVTQDGIDAERKIARGYRYRGGDLQRVQTALPRILYDRCFGSGARASAHWLRTLAETEGLTVINHPVRLTKLSTFEAVSDDAGLRHLVPFTEQLSADSLRAAAKLFDTLYVKPDNLSKGRGVCRVRRDGTNWLLDETGPDGPVTRTFGSADELVQSLPANRPYLVQEGLDLATYMGNRYDFRALVQKDGSGAWQLSGLVARIAPVDGVVTSPRSGGVVAPALRALEHSFGPGRGRQVLYDLTRACLRIAARLEHVYGLCVELGLDMGVTRDARIYLIEANGRPLKVSLVRLNDPAINGPIIRQPINFAASLDMQEKREEIFS